MSASSAGAAGQAAVASTTAVDGRDATPAPAVPAAALNRSPPLPPPSPPALVFPPLPPSAVPTLFPGVTIHPGYLPPTEAAALVAALDALPPRAWRATSGRRVMNVGGLPHARGLLPMPLPRWLTSAPVWARLAADFFPSAAPPNHVLVNGYARGGGILPHADGPVYAPRAVILSLGVGVTMDYWRELGAVARSGRGGTNGGSCGSGVGGSGGDANDGGGGGGQPPPEGDTSTRRRRVGGVRMEHGSVLVMEGEAYTDMLHGIDGVEGGGGAADGEPVRYSLTVRRVPRTLKPGIRLFNR